MSASIEDAHSSEEEDLHSRHPSGRLPSGTSGDGDVDLQGHEVELMGEVMDEDLGEGLSGHHGYDEPIESEEQPQSPTFDPTSEGLKEINNLAHFGVSSHKPGSGVEELLSEDLSKYWQYVNM
jgi:anaphase-promoting complex subunit 10